MLRWGLRLLFAAVLLFSVGYLGTIAWAVFEWIRIAAAGCLAAGLVLLFINYLRTPDPQAP
jgi:hypothetical protein